MSASPPWLTVSLPQEARDVSDFRPVGHGIRGRPGKPTVGDRLAVHVALRREERWLFAPRESTLPVDRDPMQVFWAALGYSGSPVSPSAHPPTVTATGAPDPWTDRAGHWTAP